MNRDRENEAIAFHYTTHEKFLQITSSGVLKPTNIGTERDEKPILWFTTLDRYEPTAFKMKRTTSGTETLSFEEMKTLGLYRFCVPSARLIHWSRLWRAARMKKEVAITLERTGIAQGSSSSRWFGCLSEMSITSDGYWEKLQGDEWFCIG